MEVEVEVSGAPMERVAASAATLMAVATEVGSAELAIVEVASAVSLLVSWVVPLRTSVSLVVPLVPLGPFSLIIEEVEVIPASSRVICFETGFGEWWFRRFHQR